MVPLEPKINVLSRKVRNTADYLKSSLVNYLCAGTIAAVALLSRTADAETNLKTKVIITNFNCSNSDSSLEEKLNLAFRSCLKEAFEVVDANYNTSKVRGVIANECFVDRDEITLRSRYTDIRTQTGFKVESEGAKEELSELVKRHGGEVFITYLRPGREDKVDLKEVFLRGEKANTGLGAQIVIPMISSGNSLLYPVGFGVEVNGRIRLADRITVLLGVGYNIFGTKEGDSWAVHVGYLPLGLDYHLNFGSNNFMGIGAGISPYLTNKYTKVSEHASDVLVGLSYWGELFFEKRYVNKENISSFFFGVRGIYSLEEEILHKKEGKFFSYPVNLSGAQLFLGGRF
ncbi:MAG: hypothetical protein AABX04_01155 [Nanoarchaeota archaeon]